MLNFKHLHYFWVVAKQGSIAEASKRLHITPQTISGQISLLEQHLGSPLFEKAGRGLALTAAGRLVAERAEAIFNLGQDLEVAIRRQSDAGQLPLRIGVTEVVPKTIATRLLEPVLLQQRFLCREGNLRELLAELAVNRLDIILADAPIPDGLSVKGQSYLLGQSGVAFLAPPGLASAGAFPACLAQMPLLLPSGMHRVQGRLLAWFEEQSIAANIVGEFDDSALMKAFGHAGLGVFVVPEAIADQVAEQYGVTRVGSTEAVREEFYVITSERRASQAMAQQLVAKARGWL